MTFQRRDLRQWSRTATAIGILFASMPVAGKIVLGVWAFPQAAVMAVICFVSGAYLYIRGRRRLIAIPDGAAMIDHARRLSASGNVSKAIAVLTEAWSLDPKLWQALEYRGQLHLSRGEYGKALDDLSEAIRMAPLEKHLHALRAEVYRQQPGTDD